MLKNYRSADQGDISPSRRLEAAVLEDLTAPAEPPPAPAWDCLPFLDLRRPEEAFLACFAAAEPPP